MLLAGRVLFKINIYSLFLWALYYLYVELVAKLPTDSAIHHRASRGCQRYDDLTVPSIH